MRNEEHKEVWIEIFIPTVHEHTDAKKRFMPRKGQGLKPSMRVEYSRTIRNRYPIGTKLKVRAKVTDREDGPLFLYSYHGWKPLGIKLPADSNGKD